MRVIRYTHSSPRSSMIMSFGSTCHYSLCQTARSLTKVRLNSTRFHFSCSRPYRGLASESKPTVKNEQTWNMKFLFMKISKWKYIRFLQPISGLRLYGWTMRGSVNACPLKAVNNTPLDDQLNELKVCREYSLRNKVRVSWRRSSSLPVCDWQSKQFGTISSIGTMSSFFSNEPSLIIILIRYCYRLSLYHIKDEMYKNDCYHFVFVDITV